mmetsp:Transcript_20144/g.44688  ORF Transcript_20144/g.44688 Transcript_20144/m.44688 type:complete len:246 (+) Transcript_20144:36-773(+)
MLLVSLHVCRRPGGLRWSSGSGRRVPQQCDVPGLKIAIAVHLKLRGHLIACLEAVIADSMNIEKRSTVGNIGQQGLCEPNQSSSLVRNLLNSTRKPHWCSRFHILPLRCPVQQLLISVHHIGPPDIFCALPNEACVILGIGDFWPVRGVHMEDRVAMSSPDSNSQAFTAQQQLGQRVHRGALQELTNHQVVRECHSTRAVEALLGARGMGHLLALQRGGDPACVDCQASTLLSLFHHRSQCLSQW